MEKTPNFFSRLHLKRPFAIAIASVVKDLQGEYLEILL